MSAEAAEGEERDSELKEKKDEKSVEGDDHIKKKTNALSLLTKGATGLAKLKKLKSRKNETEDEKKVDKEDSEPKKKMGVVREFAKEVGFAAATTAAVGIAAADAGYLTERILNPQTAEEGS
ncbi:hypothetical protein Tcan_13859 [Toxocara canis]|uniref:Uncharacterized protein n=1 Tax=Toxocara canis TaxID=6265 RepID=A0A0B2UZI1_TOXCA|nr:hypothetical protein Tcan_13859 [Toxocara canis]